MLLELNKNKSLRYILILAFSLLSSSLSAGDQLVNSDEIIEDARINSSQLDPKTPQSDDLSTGLTIDESEFANLPEALPQEIQQTTTEIDSHDTDKENSKDDAKPINDLEKEKLELLLKKILVTFEKISVSLEHIALVLNNNQVRIKNKEPMIEEIIKLRSLTRMIVGSVISEINLEKITHLITLEQQLIDHVRYLLTTDLMTFTSFDHKMQPLSRSALEKPPAQTLEQLETSLKQNNILLGKLENESVNVGLNIFNVFFRRIEKLNDDYKLVNKCLWGLGGVAATAGLILILEPSYLKKIGDVFDKALKFVGLQPTPKDATEAILENSGTLPPLKIYNPYNVADIVQKQSSFSTENQVSSQEYPNALEIELNSNTNGIVTKFFLWLKSYTGDALTGKMHMEQMPRFGKTIGDGTKLQNLFTRTLPILVLGIPPISIFALLAPTLKDAGNNCLEWFQGKRAQLASLLRGGPIKTALGKYERETKVTFDDIIGNEHAKMVLSRYVNYLVDHEDFDRSGIPPGNAVICVGKTRTGKTHTIDAFVGETRRRKELKGDVSKLEYWYMNAAELKKHGVTNVLMVARYYAPIVVFIDEIDKGRFQKDGDSDALCELQVAMSQLNIDIKNKVIVVAATNNPENMDSSIRADGRFGERIPFNLPSMEERQEYLTRELAKRAAIIDEDYIEQLAFETENCNYDGLKAILVTAFQKAKIKGVSLSPEELDEALNEQFHKMIFNEKILPDKELLLIAAHQSAHALTRIILNPSLQLTKVTVRPVAPNFEESSVLAETFSASEKKEVKFMEYGCVFTSHKSSAQQFDTYKDLISELKICLAGHVAEKILFGGTSFSYHEHDTEEAFDLAKRIVFHGMQEKNMPKAIKEQKLVEAYELVQKYEQDVTELLAKHKDELTALTNILFEFKTLSTDTIIHILKRLKKKKENEEKKENTEVSSTITADNPTIPLELPSEDTSVELIDAPIEIEETQEAINSTDDFELNTNVGSI